MFHLDRFWHHATLDKLRVLEARLEELSQPSADYFVLLTGSTVIATLGLFENSAGVIIGAMIIAPLMRPLMGLSFGSLTADAVLLRRSAFTLLVGSLVGVLIAYCLALLLQSIEFTPEILARTRPTLLDLGVAIFAGAIGAYCQANEKLADTLAGVAIAVALVPPLSVIGIGLANQSLSVWTGAALLYATNLVGITVAAAIVFLVLGYTPLRLAKRGLIISGSVLSLLVIPLGFSMHELLLENQFSKQIKRILKEHTFTFRNAQLYKVEVRRFKRPMEVIATVYGSEGDFSQKQVAAVQDFLESQTGIPLQFQLRIVPLKEMSAVELTPSGSSQIPQQPDTSPAIAPHPSSLRSDSESEPASESEAPSESSGDSVK